MVGQVVVDAQHIIPPPAGCRAGVLLFVRLERFTLINGLAPITACTAFLKLAAFGISIDDTLQELLLVLVDESIEAVGRKRILELHHGQEKMRHIHHFIFGQLAVMLHELHELSVLVRGIQLAMRFLLFTEVFLPVNVLTQFLLHFVDGQVKDS